jgi:hypothetical protein
MEFDITEFMQTECTETMVRGEMLATMQNSTTAPDIRDILARVYELKCMRESTPNEDMAVWELSKASKELAALECTLEDMLAW